MPNQGSNRVFDDSCYTTPPHQIFHGFFSSSSPKPQSPIALTSPTPIRPLNVSDSRPFVASKRKIEDKESMVKVKAAEENATKEEGHAEKKQKLEGGVDSPSKPSASKIRKEKASLLLEHQKKSTRQKQNKIKRKSRNDVFSRLYSMHTISSANKLCKKKIVREKPV